MYLEFYNLKEEPFSLSPDPGFLYLSEVHKEALAHLRYGLIQRKGFVVITGEVGTGKTTLINTLFSEIPQEVKAAFISNPKLERDEFFYLLSRKFQIGDEGNKAKFLINFTEFLEDASKQQQNVVLIIDEAHCLTEELLEEIRLLSNLETPHAKLVNIILAGQPEFEKTLAHPKFRALKQRITLHYRLIPLNMAETHNYIKVRLSKAGAKDVGIFSQKALELIYEFSKGIPRIINLLADRSLLTGFVKETRTIDDKIIRECAQELGLDTNSNGDLQSPQRMDAKSGKAFSGRLFLRAGIIFMILFAIVVATWYFSLSVNEKQNLVATLTNMISSGKLWGK